MIKHLLFDLDGTLLPIDLDFFFQDYLSALSAKFTAFIPADEFKEKLIASTMAMVRNQDPSLTNEEVFWQDFPSRIGFSRAFLEPILLNFYQNEYCTLGNNIPATGQIRELLTFAIAKGFKITIATNPIFPHYALIERLSWINCHDLPYQIVTSMERMHFCKPNPAYYQEILELLGAKAEECLMIGNDVEEDMVAATLGIKTCLVTDLLISRDQLQIEPDYRCRLTEVKSIIDRLSQNSDCRVHPSGE